MSRRATGMIVAMVIARREAIRLVRQPARVTAAIGTPLLIWALMASGLSGALGREPLGDTGYTAFLLPGMMTLVAVLAAIFSSISIIEDRQDGWLRAVLVAPVPRWSIALGKIIGGSMVGFAQAALLLPAAPLVGVSPSATDALIVLAALLLTCVAMSSLGLCFAWRCESTASFHAVMNLVFAPMWLLSGAFFPADSAAPWLRALVVINPLSWCTDAVRGPLLDESWVMPLGLTGLLAATMFALAVATVGRATIVLR